AHFMAHIRSPGEQLQVFSFFTAGFFFSAVSAGAAWGFSTGAGFSATGGLALSLLELLTVDFFFDVLVLGVVPTLAVFAGASFGASAAAVPVAGGCAVASFFSGSGVAAWVG